jgi:hypothetical protein
VAVRLADFCVSFFGLIETSSNSLPLQTSRQFECGPALS